MDIMDVVVDLYCPDCGAHLGRVTVSPLIEGQDFFCVDCALSRLEQENKPDPLASIRGVDVTFDVMRTNKGVCTYLP